MKTPAEALEDARGTLAMVLGAFKVGVIEDTAVHNKRSGKTTTILSEVERCLEDTAFVKEAS